MNCGELQTLLVFYRRWESEIVEEGGDGREMGVMEELGSRRGGRGIRK